MTTFIELSQNIALILSLTFIYGFIDPRLERITGRTRQALRGLFFGGFAVISMTTPIQVEPGLFYDARTIVIFIAGLYGGATSALISVLVIGIYRISMGGIGIPGAVASGAVAVLMGVGLHEYYVVRRGTKPSAAVLLLCGVVLAVVGLIFVALLTHLGINIIQTSLPLTIILYPIGVLLLGLLLSQQQRRQEIEHALHESEQRFHAVFDSAFEFIGLLKPNGTVIEVNQAALDLRHLDANAVVGIPFWEILWGKSTAEQQARIQEAVSRAAGGDIVRSEFTLQADTLPDVTLDFSLKPLKGEDGKISLLIAEGHDITARKQLEQHRVILTLEQERSRLLKKFISDVSHDLRTPLAVIRLNLELLRRTLELPQQQQRIETLASQEQHLTRLLADMMTMMTLDEQSNFQFKPLDLNFVAQLVVDGQHGAAQHKQQNLIYKHPDEASVIQGDQVELERALTKLVVNALSYTPKGGTVTLSIRMEPDYAVIEICDTGIGISPEDLPNIFQRFYRADRARSMDTGGTGLGLAITRRIVEAHNGQIDVESTVDVGTTFRIRLPLTADELPKTSPDMLFD